MNEQTLLPKFSPPPVRRPEAPAAPPQPSGVMTTGSLFDERAPKPAISAEAEPAAQTKAATLSEEKLSASREEASQMRVSFFRRLFRRKPARNTFGVAVQTEWKLETVRVVRNDLSESDLELIPARSRSAPAAEPVLEAPAKAELPLQPFTNPPPGKGWGLFSRLFKRRVRK